MGAVEFADKEVDVGAELVGGTGAGDVGSPFVVEFAPVVAVEGGVEEAPVEGAPGLFEDDAFFLIEVDLEAGGDGDGAGGTGIERQEADAAVFEVDELFGVRGEGVVNFAAGGGGELARDGGLARELIERVGVDLLLVGGGGEEDEDLAVGADDGVSGREAEGEDGEAAADAFEDDLDGIDGLGRGGGGACSVAAGGASGVSRQCGGGFRRDRRGAGFGGGGCFRAGGLIGVRQVRGTGWPVGAEKLAELVFAEARDVGEEVDASDLDLLGALRGFKEDELAVGRPGDGAAGFAVGEEGDGLGRAAGGGNDAEVAEAAWVGEGEGDPLVIGRPGEGGAVELAMSEDLVGDGSGGGGGDGDEMEVVVILGVGDGLAVGGPDG